MRLVVLLTARPVQIIIMIINDTREEAHHSPTRAMAGVSVDGVDNMECEVLKKWLEPLAEDRMFGGAGSLAPRSSCGAALAWPSPAYGESFIIHGATPWISNRDVSDAHH